MSTILLNKEERLLAPSKISEAIEVLREYTRKVHNNECALTDLIFKTHVSKGCDEYRQFNNQMATMKQLKLEGIETLAGAEHSLYNNRP